VYRGPVFVTNRTLGRFEIHGVDPRECFEELGLSVGFTHVEELVPGATEWLGALEADLGMPRGSASMTVFVNGRHSGLSVHCDPHEQIAIHLRGPKAFRLRAHPARFPCMKHVPGIATPPPWLAQSPDGLVDVMTFGSESEHVELQPGTVLFTPRGMYHETLAGDGLAMTAVIEFANPTPAQLLAKYLETVLHQSEEWRRPLDFAWSPAVTRRESARARMAELLARAAARIGTLSIDRLFASAESGAQELTETTRLQRDPSTRVTLGDGDGHRVRVEIATDLGAGQLVTAMLPIALQPLLEWLAHSRAPFTIDEACARFSDWSRAAIVSTIASFVRTRALVELPFEAW
jgi:ribosomal protein L16 Arg81 hydroxylase